LFGGEWRDGTEKIANFDDFSENAMKEVVRYMYTGKLKVDISTIMGVLKIGSYLGLERLTRDSKQYLLNGYLNAFDLCILYCEVREEHCDFDDMRAFLS
jgi:BTB/POZ domain